MGIIILEQDDKKVMSCSENEKAVERKELLPQLTVYTMEKTATNTFG
jgi:hypothetical protein